MSDAKQVTLKVGPLAILAAAVLAIVLFVLGVATVALGLALAGPVAVWVWASDRIDDWRTRRRRARVIRELMQPREETPDV